MKKNYFIRLDQLDEIIQQRKRENTVHESFYMDNKTVWPNTWTQKGGLKRGEPIEFETPRDALDWVIAQMDENTRCQVYLDDIRDILPIREYVIFERLCYDAPDRKVLFDLRKGTDVVDEAMRLWIHFLSGIAYLEWWETVDARIEDLLQSAENYRELFDSLDLQEEDIDQILEDIVECIQMIPTDTGTNSDDPA